MASAPIVGRASPDVRLESAATASRMAGPAFHGAGISRDGKIAVGDLEKKVRIRTGEMDADAL